MDEVDERDAVEQLLAAHGDELRGEVLERLPASVRALAPEVELEQNLDSIEPVLVFVNGEGVEERLWLAPYEVGTLAHLFPEIDFDYW